MGGEGADTFVFTRQDVTDGARDWIEDFKVGVDRLDVSDFTDVGSYYNGYGTIVQGFSNGVLVEIADLIGVTATSAELLLT